MFIFKFQNVAMGCMFLAAKVIEKIQKSLDVGAASLALINNAGRNFGIKVRQMAFVFVGCLLNNERRMKTSPHQKWTIRPLFGSEDNFSMNQTSLISWKSDIEWGPQIKLIHVTAFFEP